MEKGILKKKIVNDKETWIVECYLDFTNYKKEKVSWKVECLILNNESNTELVEGKEVNCICFPDPYCAIGPYMFANLK